jgi:hypothetical protein
LRPIERCGPSKLAGAGEEKLTLRWTGPLPPLIELVFATRTRRYVELEADTFTALAEGCSSARDDSR